MSSLVSEFIINPVLRQARRFSEISRSTFAGDGEDAVNPQLQSDAVSDDSDHDNMPATPPAQIDAHGLAGPLPAAEPVDIADRLQPSSRPISSSTQETRVDETASTPLVVDGSPRDHLGFPLTPPRKITGHIPEDDGMRELRSRIQAINAQEIHPSEKARLMHEIIIEGYRASKGGSFSNPQSPTELPLDPTRDWEESASHGPLDSFNKFLQTHLGEPSAAEKFVLTESDIAPTYAPIRQPKTPPNEENHSSPPSPQSSQPPLGCQHYERNVKLQCFTCKKWYTCRFCHDAAEDHSLVRKETRNMLCMLCATPQRASEACINCGEIAAQYYCNICKLWENRANKPIYHCNDCGICRRGLGLGKDFFHCKTCNACITTSIESSHKCIERSTDCDCPICGEYMFTSPKPVVFMTCGHSIHKKCYDQHMKVSYKCPICNKSLVNMETQFRNLDLAIQGQPMPPEFRDTKAVVLCNDCSGRSTVPYHWLGLKCSICRSYNTVELQIRGGEGQELPDYVMDRDIATAELTPQQAVAASQVQPAINAIAPPAAARPVPAGANRRRHSSHGVELQYRMPDRIARSLSPPGFIPEPLMETLAQESDSDDGFLGFWASRVRYHGSSDESEYESDDMSNVQSEDIDDDDDEEDIVLIGHR